MTDNWPVAPFLNFICTVDRSPVSKPKTRFEDCAKSPSTLPNIDKKRSVICTPVPVIPPAGASNEEPRQLSFSSDAKISCDQLASICIFSPNES